MSDHIKIVGGYIEKNYERIAQVLPGIDERDVREAIVNASDDAVSEAYDEGYADAKSKLEDEAQDALANFNDRIDRFLDRLLSDGTISKKQHDAICVGMPSE